MEQQMACGSGMCFCCVRDFNVGGEIVHKRVCWDGPVFDLMEATAVTRAVFTSISPSMSAALDAGAIR